MVVGEGEDVSDADAPIDEDTVGVTVAVGDIVTIGDCVGEGDGDPPDDVMLQITISARAGPEDP